MEDQDGARPATRRAAREAAEDEREHRVRFRSGFSTLRDFLLFIAGMAIIVTEVWFSPSTDAALLGVGVALTGAPLVLGADERKSAK